MWSDAARAASAAARKGAGGGLGKQIQDAQNRRAEGAAAGMSADALAANTLAGGHPKSGLVGIHSASAISRGITKMRLAFHNSDG